MADEFQYRDYVIRATPSALKDGGWTHDGVVSHYLRQMVDQRKFNAPGTSATREAAVSVILNYGMEMIDKRLV
jgi:hypothetical protein